MPSPKLTRTASALLLDMDGVTLRHHGLSAHVAQRVVSYVQRRVPWRLDRASAEEYNRRIYTQTGHTWLGLRNELGLGAGSLEEFNAWVYDDETLERLEEVYKDPVISTQRQDLLSLTRFCRDSRVPVVIFSNAPTSWCVGAAEVLGMPCQVILGSDHPVFMGRLLKPDHMLYYNVARYLQSQFQEDRLRLHFVDDTLLNLLPVTHRPDWNPLWFRPQPGDEAKAIAPATVPRVNRLEQIIPFLAPQLV